MALERSGWVATTNSLDFSSRSTVMRLPLGPVKRPEWLLDGAYSWCEGVCHLFYTLFILLSEHGKEECVLVGKTCWSIRPRFGHTKEGEKHFKLFTSSFGLSRARTHPSRLLLSMLEPGCAWYQASLAIHARKQRFVHLRAHLPKAFSLWSVSGGSKIVQVMRSFIESSTEAAHRGLSHC